MPHAQFEVKADKMPIVIKRFQLVQLDKARLPAVVRFQHDLIKPLSDRLMLHIAANEPSRMGAFKSM